MHVQPAREQVCHVVPPHDALLFQREHMLLYEPQDGREAELGVFEEAEQKFGRAVARTAPHAVDGHVEIGGAPARRLDGVAEGELLVVVRVHAHRLFVLFARFEIAQRELCHLLGVQRAVRIDEIDDVDGAFAEHAEGVVDLLVFGFGDRHHVGARFIAELFAVLDHLDGGGDLVDVAGDAHHVEHALLFGEDVFAEIRSAHVCHDGELHARLVFAHDGAQVFFVAELVFAELIGIEQRPRRLVTHLHIVDARREVHRVQRLCELVRKAEIVAQPAVAQGGVENLDIGAEGEKGALPLRILYVCHISAPKKIFCVSL